MTSKFFISKDVTNVEPVEISCSNRKQISPHVLSVSPIDGIKPTKDLFTVLFDELNVNYHFFEERFFYKLL
jgi:hypothetical protein